MTEGAVEHPYLVLDHNDGLTRAAGVIEESMFSLSVDGEEIATMMCSPFEREALAVGWLYHEGIIETRSDIGHIQTNATGGLVDVFLTRPMPRESRRFILTSGCGGGVVMDMLTADYPALDTPFHTTPAVLRARMADLREASTLYHQVRGVHVAVLANEKRLLTSAEDIGRHNAVDKVAGKALLADLPLHDGILLTSGRISSEMLSKARRMGTPVVVSRTSPTSMSIQLAQAWNMCLVGYLRQKSMRVYTHPWRLGIQT